MRMIQSIKQNSEMDNRFSIFLMENNMGKILKLLFFRFWRHTYLEGCKIINYSWSPHLITVITVE